MILRDPNMRSQYNGTETSSHGTKARLLQQLRHRGVRVAAALCDGTLSGLGLDVYDVEPPDVSHPVFSHPNVVLTPHMLGLSVRAGRQTFEEAADNVRLVLTGGQAPAVKGVARRAQCHNRHSA